MGKKHGETDIIELQQTKKFRERYAKYIRKLIKAVETIRTNLHGWFCKYKCSASEGANPAEGRLDPRNGQTLFTSATKQAVENAQKKPGVIQDLVPIEEMYREVKPPARALHSLSKWLSKREKSKLESFHKNVGNFGNTGMKSELCDVLNLCGTAGYN